MASAFDSRLFNRAFAIDDITRRPHGRNLKFKRAFQFLQLLLIQRVYTSTAKACSTLRRSMKHQHSVNGREQDDYEVFLGGSCNPTTWRHDQAIPYFKYRSVSCYNPQVANWTPELMEIEHRAKELAPLLFFVIDHDTRALASIVEACYLAANGRSIIVVMSPMPEKNLSKFIQQKSEHNEFDDAADYENACEARRISQQLLGSLNIPVFETIDAALECAAYILETTKQTMRNESTIDKQSNEADDILTPLPNTTGDDSQTRSSSVVFIRSLSNKTSFNTPDEFYREMRQSNLNSSSVPINRAAICVIDSINDQFGSTTAIISKQISCSTQGSDDEGYATLSPSNRTLSTSNTSLASELFEPVTDYAHEFKGRKLTLQLLNKWISTWYSYLPFVGRPTASMTQSILVLLTLPFRFIRSTTFLSPLHLSLDRLALRSNEVTLAEKKKLSSLSSFYIFDIYIASGDFDQPWLNTVAFPTLQANGISFIQRQTYYDSDQPDISYDMDIRKKARLLYYLINGRERLSDLVTELAFLIGEHKSKIIVQLEPTIDTEIDTILSACERRDLQRSRKYLEDLAHKENICLSYSREDSWLQVLDVFKNDH